MIPMNCKVINVNNDFLDIINAFIFFYEIVYLNKNKKTDLLFILTSKLIKKLSEIK